MHLSACYVACCIMHRSSICLRRVCCIRVPHFVLQRICLKYLSPSLVLWRRGRRERISDDQPSHQDGSPESNLADPRTLCPHVCAPGCCSSLRRKVCVRASRARARYPGKEELVVAADLVYPSQHALLLRSLLHPRLRGCGFVLTSQCGGPSRSADGGPLRSAAELSGVALHLSACY